MRKKPLSVIKKLIDKRYSDAKAVFWGGSVSRGLGTNTSDLDIIIVYEQISSSYREAFIYENWPIDAFIHDPETLGVLFKKIKEIGICGTMEMIINGKEIMLESNFSKRIKDSTREKFDLKPLAWEKKEIDNERFLITDLLDDILYPNSRAEQIASTAKLYEQLARFYFRAQNKWSASGKSILRYLEKDNSNIAYEYSHAFEKAFQGGDVQDLKNLVTKLLAPYGGLLWDGFRFDIPKAKII
ncbi:nucleotidyltransferase domain-containing protein [Candidatus Jidaibacter acanthamoebae]|nr:nucleotidyltransferase domain-containing protein [Candidatus Jidaibacter acanthamoeba]